MEMIVNLMCCNAQLEENMNKAYNKFIQNNPNINKCNIQKIANIIQQSSENYFNKTFETIVGLNDYVSKSHFFSNYICKIKRNDKYILAYATPQGELEKNNIF
ncbi:G_PROTEIN_RECEP_F1_2 domain-containing protein [Meloidogyne graminicola]|uniref:G_PROTEIN_RECEP_F1_2 domain-containing protein n=1 Tax=Meloidogyne graminicola TaxID=189291 RepID=A0A8T0A3Z8_9BILA|nr:G_PROTEIN_RECEP_F1_2 domain-containing protein [Meloidogyne graminicola]